MNYDPLFQNLIEQLKADKSILQPWRNKAVARLEEVQAFVDEGLRTTYREPDEPVCICPPGGTHSKCPIHRDQ